MTKNYSPEITPFFCEVPRRSPSAEKDKSQYGFVLFLPSVLCTSYDIPVILKIIDAIKL